MPRMMLRLFGLISIITLVLAISIGTERATARSAQPQSGELLTNPGFEAPFVAQGGDISVANGWQAWYVTPDNATHPASCRGNPDPNCKPYSIPSYRPSQPQDARMPPHAISDNAQQWGASFAIFIAGVYQQVSGVTPGTRLQFSAFTQAFNCSNDRGCFGGSGRTGYSYEAGQNFLRVGIDPTGGTNAFSSNIVWSAYANPLDAFVQQSVETVAQSDKVTVFIWSAPNYPEKHLDIYVDRASLVSAGQGPVPTAASTQTAQPTTPAGTPGPVPTIPPGTTTYTVVAGDTLSVIAQRFGLTLDQLLTLNPGLTRDSIIQVGQAINVAGQVPTSAPTARPTPTLPASPAPAPTQTTAPTATPTVAATTVTTATAAPTSASIVSNSGLCLQAFDDLNGNLVRDANEALVPGVDFEIRSLDGQTTTNYTTDGQHEPHCVSTLPDGRYSVNTKLPDDRTATTDSAWQLSLLSGTNVSLALGTRLEVPPTAEPTMAPTSVPVAETVDRASTGSSAPLALLGGGVLIILAGVALFFGLRSRQKSA